MRVPMPGECDPYYAKHEPTLKRWLAERKHGDRVIVPELQATRIDWMSAPPAIEGSDDPREPLVKERVLTMQKCAARAPYVGRPFRYVWRVLVDNEERTVAGEAEIVYTMDEWDYELARKDPTFASIVDGW